MTNRFFQFDFKFCVLLDPKVDKRMRVVRACPSHAQFATLVDMTGFVTWKMAKFND